MLGNPADRSPIQAVADAQDFHERQHLVHAPQTPHRRFGVIRHRDRCHDEVAIDGVQLDALIVEVRQQTLTRPALADTGEMALGRTIRNE